VEAQFEVMAEMARQEQTGRKMGHPVKQARKLLDEVRRAAGRVRDMDVQREFAKEFTGSDATEEVCRDVAMLREHLKTQRDAAARDLLDVLHKSGGKLNARLGAVLVDRKQVEDVGLSAIDLEVLTRGWYAAQVSAARRVPDQDRTLHRIRLAAKLARYMAEDGLAVRVVEEFRALQEAGGRWHDCLGLRDVARRRLGKRSRLGRLLKEREARVRGEFAALAGE
jgi:CHAD domain-containing protein